jgi:hypothetical protein
MADNRRIPRASFDCRAISQQLLDCRAIRVQTGSATLASLLTATTFLATATFLAAATLIHTATLLATLSTCSTLAAGRSTGAASSLNLRVEVGVVLRRYGGFRFLLPRLQNSSHFIAFLGHFGGEVTLFAGVLLQVVQFHMATILEKLNQFVIADPNSAGGG